MTMMASNCVGTSAAAAIDPPPADVAAPSRPPRRRVLIGAYAVSPARGSEPGLGWNLSRALAAYHDVTVLCAPGAPGRDRNIYREETDAWMAQHGPVPGLTLHYVPHPFWSRLTQRERELYRRTVYYSGYASWQRAAFRAGRALHREHPFDISHHLNMLGFREPGYLWKLPMPFVWGPIAGAANIPAAFFPLMSWRDRVFYGIRNVANEIQKRTARRARAAARAAGRVWVIGDESERMVRGMWNCPAHQLLESGTTPRHNGQLRTRRADEALRIVWSGLHIGRKALPILLRALKQLGAKAPPEKLEVTVLGAGPETMRWKAEAESLELAQRVRFTGKLSHVEALAELARAHVLVSTSVQEATSLVITEALSLAVPVICHDACGMRVAITDACGIKVPLVDCRTSIDGFAAAISALLDDPEALARLSAGAMRRGDELRWESIASVIARGYHEVLAEREARSPGLLAGRAA